MRRGGLGRVVRGSEIIAGEEGCGAKKSGENEVLHVAAAPAFGLVAGAGGPGPAAAAAAAVVAVVAAQGPAVLSRAEKISLAKEERLERITAALTLRPACTVWKECVRRCLDFLAMDSRNADGVAWFACLLEDPNDKFLEKFVGGSFDLFYSEYRGAILRSAGKQGAGWGVKEAQNAFYASHFAHMLQPQPNWTFRNMLRSALEPCKPFPAGSDAAGPSTVLSRDTGAPPLPYPHVAGA